MEREILFRGRDIKDVSWIYGDYTSFPKIGIRDRGCFHEVIPETLGQYTGLVDSTGSKIFEGDLVSWGKPPIEIQERIAEVVINPDIQLHVKNIKHPHIFHWCRFAYPASSLQITGSIHDK